VIIQHGRFFQRRFNVTPMTGREFILRCGLLYSAAVVPTPNASTLAESGKPLLQNRGDSLTTRELSTEVKRQTARQF